MTHRLCRPPVDAVDCIRLTASGKWVKDDGRPGLAFSWLSPTELPMAGAVACDCAGSCPKRKAMDYTARRFGAANGTALQPVRKSR